MKIILLWSFTVLYFSFAQYEVLEKQVLNEDGITYSASLSGTSCRSHGAICTLGDGSLERSIALEF